jgi:hypothetical protein
MAKAALTRLDQIHVSVSRLLWWADFLRIFLRLKEAY